MNKKSTVKELYNRSAKFYDQRYYKIQFNKFDELLKPLSNNDVIIDLGSGTSLLLLYEKIKNVRYVGIDISSEMIKQGRKKEKKFKEFIISDVENIPLRSDFAHTITVFTVLQNLESYFNIFKEIKRISIKKSIIYLSVLRKKINWNSLNNILLESSLEIIEKLDKKESEDIGLILINN